MRIEELRPAPGSRKKPKRVGRGPGSGHGKTATKGHKGQKARSGGTKGKRVGFEGGQMPLQRRLPKRGFNNPNKKVYSIINVGRIEGLGLSVVSPESLLENNIISSLRDGLKVLGDGELKRAVTVRAHLFSGTARKKISEAGGRAEVI